MRTAIDTNVIVALWSQEPLASQARTVLNQSRAEGALVVSGPVFVELIAHPRADESFVQKFLHETDISVDFELGQAAWNQAATAFKHYAERHRQSGGGDARRLLADFIIGAHALSMADRLLTADAKRYQTSFPTLQILPM